MFGQIQLVWLGHRTCIYIAAMNIFMISRQKEWLFLLIYIETLLKEMQTFHLYCFRLILVLERLTDTCLCFLRRGGRYVNWPLMAAHERATGIYNKQNNMKNTNPTIAAICFSSHLLEAEIHAVGKSILVRKRLTNSFGERLLWCWCRHIHILATV